MRHSVIWLIAVAGLERSRLEGIIELIERLSLQI